MDDDFVKAVNKFNAKFSFHNRKNLTKGVNNNVYGKNDKTKQGKADKLKEDLELQYIHNSNNKICQKFLTLPLSKKEDKLSRHSDKVILPVSILKTLEKGTYRNEVEFPYSFSLKNVENNYITHACVLEFSSNEGIILVSENIKENLGIIATSGIIRLLVTYANLPKCDFIKFESLNENINDIKFMKNLLENELSINYSTLTLGDHVHINHLNFYVSELEPDNAVSLINTDIVVDICKRKIMCEQFSTFQNVEDTPYEVINSTTTNVNSSMKCGIKKYKYMINYNILELLKKDKININFLLSSNDVDNFNIFISFPPYDSVSETMHHLHFDDCSKDIQINRDIIKKCLKIHFVCFMKEQADDVQEKLDATKERLDEQDPFLEYIYDQYFPHIIYIGISYTTENEVQYSLSSKVDSESRKTIKEQIDNTNKNKTNDRIPNNKLNELRENCKNELIYVTCDNCLKQILENNINMHKIHCLNNISLCNICKKPFNKKDILDHIHCEICNEGIKIAEKNKHNFLWHTKIKCTCQKYFYRKQFIFHQKLFCPKKIIFCAFCNIFTVSAANIFNEDYILANFLDKFDSYNGTSNDNNSSSSSSSSNNNNELTVKSIDYYFQLMHKNFHFFVKHINSTEHEKYCGSKSVMCVICKTNMYRNRYFTHLNLMHNMDKKESFKIINENTDV
ncbi:ubiquitin fusion degradation protein 1, putative [Plasmodium malariae]|uniref:Ubiquitin fusion degradation protein 1, putative n=1 Tax=Plasmodium malariae TaxID=5858 RepID=A0A1D3RHR7_PLAMA|nr:ubiquitin fusion degradation protein 1, putative [Plasmodium malariae]SCN44694.1 ubiquitin fusion degradation protein 1, putative [Plasmodium malariae]